MASDQNTQISNDDFGEKSTLSETGVGEQNSENECLQEEVVSPGASAESETSAKGEPLSSSKKSKRQRVLDKTKQGVELVRNNTDLVRTGHKVYKVADEGLKLIKFIRNVVIVIVVLIILALIPILIFGYEFLSGWLTALMKGGAF